MLSAFSLNFTFIKSLVVPNAGLEAFKQEFRAILPKIDASIEAVVYMRLHVFIC